MRTVYVWCAGLVIGVALALLISEARYLKGYRDGLDAGVGLGKDVGKSEMVQQLFDVFKVRIRKGESE